MRKVLVEAIIPSPDYHAHGVVLFAIDPNPPRYGILRTARHNHNGNVECSFTYLGLENPVHEASGSFVIAGVVLPRNQARQALFQDGVDDGRHEGYDEVEQL